METITYEVKKGLYLNITNRCPCSCTFCIRNNDDHVYGSDPLWLDHEPSVTEICDAIDQRDLWKYEEVVFCGYGEPTERLDALLEVAAYIKKKSPIRIRVNTNGLSDLIYGEKTAPKLKGLIDVVSISLNATNPEDYLKMVRPKFGIGSFDAMLSFAKDCKAYVPDVVMTIVDTVTTKEEQEKSLQICNDLSVRLRIREYEG
ncbi:MAG: TIGR04100 family radical SAM protein [Lachnospiraceae bacterium]|nr:TIGR04100 family radical SAM protein [Lachnospiraceae bacterium]MBR2842283.1 TIGR04100 family radical SAM protein [Lachnospiraceae bacterium]